MTTKSYIVTKDKAQTLTNKTLDADSNVITNLEGDNFKTQPITEAGKTYGVKPDGTIGLIANGGVLIDNTTIVKNTSDQLAVKENKFLELAGGTMSGTIKSSATNTILGTGNATTVASGENASDGAVRLYPASNTVYPGRVELDTTGGNKLVVQGASATFGPSADEGYKILRKIDCVRNLTTNDGYLPLAASQGKALNDGKEDKSNKTTYISASSTDTQYPSAKAVHDYCMPIGDLDVPIVTSASPAVKCKTDNSNVTITGGTSASSGASITLNGSSAETNPNTFKLSADSDNILVGSSDGLKWNDKNLATTEDLSGYLPLHGGVMEGPVIFGSDQNIALYRQPLTDYLEIDGGGSSISSYVRVYGGEHASNSGVFDICARKSGAAVSLIGKSNGTLTWNGKNLATTNQLSSYLPLAGGTMTGTITSSTNDVVKKSAATGQVNIYSGTSNTTGSYISLHGGSQSGNQGNFEINATKDSSTSTQLKGTPEGSLTWGGKSLITETYGTPTASSKISEGSAEYWAFGSMVVVKMHFNLSSSASSDTTIYSGLPKCNSTNYGIGTMVSNDNAARRVRVKPSSTGITVDANTMNSGWWSGIVVYKKA